jgi:hypothetical protein
LSKSTYQKPPRSGLVQLVDIATSLAITLHRMDIQTGFDIFLIKDTFTALTGAIFQPL